MTIINFIRRLTEKKVKFRHAVVECLTIDPTHYGPVVNLIRVGQLRKFRNVESHRLDKKRNQKVRVDAVKDLVSSNLKALQNEH